MISREALEAQLAGHNPGDEEERGDLERMRADAMALEQPCSRDQARAHFTASAVVVDDAGERTLLVHHRKSGSWFQPGGHIEPEDSSPADAALREVREETGLAVHLAQPDLLDVDVHWVPWDEHYHLDLRFLVIAAGELAPDSAEVLGAEWLSWDQAFARVDETGLRRALEKARRATRPSGG